MKRFLIVLALVLASALGVSAQSTVQLASRSFGGSNATISANGASITADDTRGLGTMQIQTVGTYTGTLEFQCTLDNTNYKQVDVTPVSSQTPQGSISTEDVFTAAVSGRKCRVTSTAWTSGTVAIYMLGTFAGGAGSGGGGGGGGNAAASSTGSAVPSSADYQGVNVAGTLRGETGIAAGSHFAQTVAIVDSSGNQISTFGGSGGTSVNEDVASADAQPGTPAFTVRNNTLTGATSTDGDYQPQKSTAAGALYIAPTFGDTIASVGNGASGAQTQRVTIANDSTGVLATVSTVTSLSQFAGQAINLGAGAVGTGTLRITQASDSPAVTSLQLIDDPVFTLGTSTYTEATSKAFSIAAVRRDADTTLVDTTNEFAPLQLNAAGQLKVACITGCSSSGGSSLTDDAAFTVGSTAFTVAGGTYRSVRDQVDDNDGGGFAMTIRRALYTTVEDAAGALTFGTSAALADNTSNPTLGGVAAYLMCFDGSTWDRCPTSTGGSGTIDSNTTRVTIATDDPVNDAAVKFDAQMVADDAASAGNPLYIGGLATASIVGQTPVAGADRIGFVGGLDRVLITRPHSNLEDRVSAVVGVTDGSSTSLVSAQGSGVRFCATTLIVSNSSATNVTVDIRDGTAGSVIATIPAAANMGGGVVPLQTPLCTTANTAMAMDPSASATTVTVTAIGFKTEL